MDMAGLERQINAATAKLNSFDRTISDIRNDYRAKTNANSQKIDANTRKVDANTKAIKVNTGNIGGVNMKQEKDRTTKSLIQIQTTTDDVQYNALSYVDSEMDVARGKIATQKTTLQNMIAHVDDKVTEVNQDVINQKATITKDYKAAVTRVDTKFSDFKSSTFDGFKKKTTNDLRQLRVDMADDLKQKTGVLGTDLDDSVSAFKNFKVMLRQAVVNASTHSKLAFMTQGVAPKFNVKQPRITTSEAGGVEIVSRASHITVNEVEIPNARDLVLSVNEGVAKGFQVLSEAMVRF